MTLLNELFFWFAAYQDESQQFFFILIFQFPLRIDVLGFINLFEFFNNFKIL